MTSISQAISGTIELLTVGREIYQSIANAMDAAELEANSGSYKFNWVMAYAKSLIIDAGKNWDKWAEYVANFINAAKSIYNSLRGLF